MREALSDALAYVHIAGAVVLIWAFKMHEDAFRSTRGIKLWTHDTSGGLLGAGVCALGKVAGWILIGWLVASTVVLRLSRGKGPGAIVVTTCVLLGAVFSVCYRMNRPLFVRSIPFIMLEAGAMILLHVASRQPRQIMKAAIENDEG